MLRLIETFNWILVGLAVVALVASIVIQPKDEVTNDYIYEDSMAKTDLGWYQSRPAGSSGPRPLPENRPSAERRRSGTSDASGRGNESSGSSRSDAREAGGRRSSGSRRPDRRDPGVQTGGPRARSGRPLPPEVIVSHRFRNRLEHYQEAYSVAMEAASRPTTHNGRNGREITRIDQGSLLRRVGRLEPGDVILSVNGNPIPESAQEGRALYERLKSESRFTVELVRNGEVQTVTYRYR